MAEEWERCEKKLKDVGHWLEATARTLEAPQNAKKPLRDRLAFREKLINDISTQKTKISYAVEKLNVSQLTCEVLFDVDFTLEFYFSYSLSSQQLSGILCWTNAS